MQFGGGGVGGESCGNLEHVCFSEALGPTRQHTVDEHVPSLDRLLSNEQLVCSLSLRRVCPRCVSGGLRGIKHHQTKWPQCETL